MENHQPSAGETREFVSLVGSRDAEGLKELMGPSPLPQWNGCVANLSHKDRAWVEETFGYDQ